MIKDTDGVIRSHKDFTITVVDRNFKRTDRNHWNCSLTKEHFKLNKGHECYVRTYEKLLHGVAYNYHELINDIDTWYKVKYIKLEGGHKFYNIISITSAHEILELEAI